MTIHPRWALVGLLLGGALLLALHAARAQTLAQRIVACTADVRALCAPGFADIADHRRICRCMIENHSRLSPGCRAMAPLAGLRQCAR